MNRQDTVSLWLRWVGANSLAEAMGLGLGLVLAFPQWRVLRTAVPRAWVWLPANAAAWAVGMPIIFALIDLAQRSSSTAVIILTILMGLFITGAVVGAVHGLALVWLARPLPTTLRAAH